MNANEVIANLASKKSKLKINEIFNLLFVLLLCNIVLILSNQSHILSGRNKKLPHGGGIYESSATGVLTF